eukprot:gnl/TRDRNA2_/TRDRNA2_208127_c0_seq1.p1 gnl/TRDRNA2_/TRDRNA2_208127_c0~~gnl/TRDRNA2_/TRDRNA2_208127_c0_seq1.p1  ORF type:complete len:274 (-),score=35.17 gnl/TRDRNA2_/TRDRNA2_208127_c0_seq1:69-890(-)
MEPGGDDEPLPKRQKTQPVDEKALGLPKTICKDAFSSKALGLRFSVGQRVLCNISKRASGFVWKAGTITSLAYKPSQEEVQKNKVVYEDEDGTDIIPYIVKLDNGQTVASPEDEDECVRLAARCSDDTRIMRQLAVSLDKKASLRFSEGDRVAVQLDIGVWEEGVIVEVWVIPERNGRPLKTWAGFAVPYAVNLDLGHCVLVPFDTDEVIRPESAARPAQKSIAEQIKGTDRVEAGENSERFITCQNSMGEWVCRDARTGFERKCAPPCPEEP